MSNLLYPIFLKLDKVPILVVGGGNVALEKVSFMFKSSPNAIVTLIAPEIKEEILEYQGKYSLKIKKRKFENSDLEGFQALIIATEDKLLNYQIWQEAKRRNLVVNVADTPDLCDFYLGSIVTKGDLKIAISTNGKSPTFAKRFREILEEALPEEIEELLDNLQQFRNSLKGDFETKVKKLNELTASLIEDC
ncbi:MAG: bifunctional precorrin-2 dehydrogenase/sirohydrochlorin ferrochelatase [Thermoflexibacter sp.]